MIRLRHPHRHGHVVVLLAMLVLCATDVPSQDLLVSASVSAETVEVEDQFQLVVTVSGKNSDEAANPRLPVLKGFRVVQGPDIGTQFQWVNGQTSSVKSFTYTLVPETQGDHRIDAIEVRMGGTVYRTKPIAVRVTGASQNRTTFPPARRKIPSFDEGFGDTRTGISEDDVFVTAEVDRQSAYPGEQVTLSYHLYTRVGITGLQLQENPPLTGFWVENLEVPENPPGSGKTINGLDYLEYVVKKQALFATATGKLRIPPSTFAISVKTRGGFFGLMGQTETIYRQTGDAFVVVAPLPDKNRPGHFKNAVGSFHLVGSLDKSEAATGDAVSLRIKLEGRGNLSMIPDIGLPPLPDFTVYSSKRTDNVRSFEADKVGGSRIWEYVLVPKVPGEQAIPPLLFSYFNPEKEEYETAATGRLTLKVTRGSDATDSSALAGADKQSLTRKGTDINFIKLSAADLHVRREPIYGRLWFYALAAAPLVLNLGILLYIRERSREAMDAEMLRSRNARRLAFVRLRKAEKAGRTEPRRFYDEAAAALSGYLGDRFGLPEIAVTTDTLERILGDKDAGVENVREAMACLQECDFGRFVAASSSADEMQMIAARIRNIIERLEQA